MAPPPAAGAPLAMSNHRQPEHILLRRQTDAITNMDMAFLERALEIQLREVASVYGLRPPGVSVVSPDTHLPQGEAVGIDFVDDDGVPGAIAHHGWNERANFAWSLVGVREAFHWTQAASHEACEYLVNLRLDRWADGPDGGRWPIEICDPVEADAYHIAVFMFGTTREIRMSNYVTPEFWGVGTTGPWDRMASLTAPFSLAPGGYALVEREGALVELGASLEGRHGSQARARPLSRVAKLRAERR